MKDEYNEEYDEVQKDPPEETNYKENISLGSDNPIPKEVTEYEEEGKSKKKVKNRAKTISKHISTVLTSAVALVAVVCIIEPYYSSDSTTVDFAETIVTDTSVSYHIVLENWSGKEYEVVLYNDFTSRTEAITEDNHIGEQDNLKPNMSYHLAVVNGTKTLAEISIKTMKTEDMPVTKLESVSCSCACSLDGTFHFQMSFIDENNWWTDFCATLEDEDGNISSCTFSDDLTELQTIPVTDIDGEGNGLNGTTATFTITCVSYENSSSGETITLWTSTEEI